MLWACGAHCTVIACDISMNDGSLPAIFPTSTPQSFRDALIAEKCESGVWTYSNSLSFHSIWTPTYIGLYYDTVMIRFTQFWGHLLNKPQSWPGVGRSFKVILKVCVRFNIDHYYGVSGQKRAVAFMLHMQCSVRTLKASLLRRSEIGCILH